MTLLSTWIFLSSRAALAEPAGEQHVLVLNSYHPQYEWTKQLVQGVEDGLNEVVAEERLHIEYMDGRRFVDDVAYQERLTALYQHKYAGFDPSVIIASDDYALLYLLEHRDEVFPGTPVVFCGINALDPEMLQGHPDYTGIFEGMEIAGNIALIREVQPTTRHIIMLGDQTSFGQRMGTRAREVMAAHVATPEAATLELELWDDFALPDLYEDVSVLDADTVLLLLAIHKDNAGNYFSFSEQLPILSRRSSVPIYGMWGGLLIGNGILGGSLNDPRLHGHNAADMARRILEGEDPSSIPIVPKAQYRPVFDHNQMLRFGVSDSALPAGSRIALRPQTFYSQNRRVVWAIAATGTLLLSIIGLLTLSIVRRRQAEALLRASELKLSLHVQRSSLGFIEWDRRLRVSGWNPSAELIFGYSEAEALGRHMSFFLPSVAPDADHGLLKEMDGSRSSTAHRHKDGKELQCVWFHTNLVANEVVMGLTSMVEDVTERSSLEAQLLQAQKMEAVGQLAGGVAHDFNNVLTIILGHLELAEIDLERDTPATEKALARLEKATEGGMRAASLIRQLLVFSRNDASQPETLDLGAALRGLDNMLHLLVPSDIVLTLDLGSDPLPVHVDRRHFEQVVMNLVVNAKDAMPRGGEIVLRADITHDNGSKQVRLSTKDTGIGMSEETRSRVFEPFFTTKPAGQGTGLGLPMVFGLVEKWSGSIAIDSEPGRGCTVTILLPLRAGEHEEPNRDQPVPAPSQTGTERILLCEDDHEIRQLVEGMLATAGYDVTSCADGREALDQVDLGNQTFDLLLTDVQMPNLGGPELASQLRAVWPDLKLLFISGYTTHALGELDGAVFLAKPFVRTALLASVRDALSVD